MATAPTDVVAVENIIMQAQEAATAGLGLTPIEYLQNMLSQSLGDRPAGFTDALIMDAIASIQPTPPAAPQPPQAPTATPLAAVTSTAPQLPASPTTTPTPAAGGGTAPAAQTTQAAPAASTQNTTPAPLAANLTDDQIVAQVEKEFGGDAWLLDIPEVRSALLPIIRQGPPYDQATIENAIQATSWYKSHSATQRSWQITQTTDPASAAEQINTMLVNINDRAQKIGFQIPEARARQLATDAVSGGWDTTQLDHAIAHEFHFAPGPSQGNIQALALANAGQRPIDPTTGRLAWSGPSGEPGYGADPGGGATSWDMPDPTAPGGKRTVWYYAQTNPRGEVGSTLDKFRQLAHQYLVPISDATLQQWTQQAIQGQTDEAGFTSYLQEQAKSLFPGLAQAIDSGITPMQYTNPYRQVAAGLLGVNPDSIDFQNSPQWMAALNQIDPKTGMRTSMSLADWQQKLMSDPTYGYQNSRGGIDRAAALATGIAQMFGENPGGGTGFAGAAPPRI